jgi:hypothetical protein
MPRQPVSNRAGAAFPDARAAVWASIRKRKQFTIEDLETDTREKNRTISTYVQSLQIGGLVEMVGHDTRGLQASGTSKSKNMNRPGIFRLIKDVGVETPRVRRDGSLVTQGSGTRNMWRVMKVLNRFDFQELALEASVDEVIVRPNTAKDYISLLHKAGYLQEVQKSKPGKAAQYRLIRSRFSGPKPPQIQRVRHVYDPNLGKVVWPQEFAQ